MVDLMGSLFPKCHQASNGKPIVNYTPMVSCVPISIHLPIIPTFPNLFQPVPSSFIGSLALFSPCLPHPIKVSPIFVA
jgi:hypothetical protein